MSIVDDINREMVGAMKAKEEVKTSTLRMLVSEVKNKQIELGHQLTDEEVVVVIAKSAKQRRESIEAYEKAGRADLADREKAELSILSAYLPKELSEVEVGKIVDEVLAGIGSVSVAETGKVIGAVMAKVAGRANGNLVSGIVRQKLASI